MLFHSSIRKELARTFAATLVVIVTVLMTMTLIRTVGEASRGVFNPSDVMLIMGYIVLSDMPTILSLSLFIAILVVLTRMYQDSEMVIWFGSGRGLWALVKPLYRFAWPILVVILTLAFFILPWAFERIEDLRDRYEKRSDIARIEPGQFQESANGDRVLFIEKDSADKTSGNNVFIATKEADKETVISAQTGRVEVIGKSKFLVLNNGQRLEKTPSTGDSSISSFAQYAARLGADDTSAREYTPPSALPTWKLLSGVNPTYQSELAWRIGLTLAAVNLVILGLATAGTNPRAGRTGNLIFAFLAFVVYFNLLILGKSWIQSGQMRLPAFLLSVHGGTFLLAVTVLTMRHFNWSARIRRRTA